MIEHNSNSNNNSGSGNNGSNSGEGLNNTMRQKSETRGRIKKKRGLSGFNSRPWEHLPHEAPGSAATAATDLGPGLLYMRKNLLASNGMKTQASNEISWERGRLKRELKNSLTLSHTLSHMDTHRSQFEKDTSRSFLTNIQET